MTRQASVATFALFLFGLLSGPLDVQAQTPTVEQRATLPSAWDLTRAPAISSLTLAPDGKHLAAVTSPDGINRYVSVWETANPSKPPTV